MNDLVTVCVVAKAEDLETARPLSLEWVKSLHPFDKQTAQDMLPTPLSPSGELPATHWLCCTSFSQAHADHMQAWIVEHKVPVEAESFVQPEDTKASQLANRETWLSAHSLKVVS